MEGRFTDVSMCLWGLNLDTLRVQGTERTRCLGYCSRKLILCQKQGGRFPSVVEEEVGKGGRVRTNPAPSEPVPAGLTESKTSDIIGTGPSWFYLSAGDSERESTYEDEQNCFIVSTMSLFTNHERASNSCRECMSPAAFHRSVSQQCLR